MTPDERKILEEAEQQAFDTAQAFYDVPTSGIRPPPSIEETETILEPELFGYDFGAQPTTEVEPFSFSGGGGTVGGACCTDGVCSIESMADCIAGGGHFLGNGTTCATVDCTQGACCHVNGTCTTEPPFMCFSPDVYKGDGTTCATERCEGACIPCQICPSDCFCVDHITYQECHDTYFNSCRGIAWFLSETCLTKDCSVWSQSCAPGVGACCNEFGDPGCTDSVTQDDCTAFGGTSWHEGCTCEDLSCWDGCEIPPGAGACCVDGGCVIAIEAVCTGNGGVYQGDGIPCSGVIC